MRVKLGTTVVAMAIATGLMASTAAPALASNCGGATVASIRKCINTRMTAQHKQIVKLQARVKSLSLTVTTQALALKVKNLTASVNNQGNNLSNVENRIGCWADSLALSEFTTGGNPWGSQAPAGGSPYPGPGNYSYMDMMQAGQPANQNVWNVLVNVC